MDDNDIPTTDEVRARFPRDTEWDDPPPQDPDAEWDREVALFDRWLKAHDAEVKAEALREASAAYPAMIRDMVSPGSVIHWLAERAEQVAAGEA